MAPPDDDLQRRADELLASARHDPDVQEAALVMLSAALNDLNAVVARMAEDLHALAERLREVNGDETGNEEDSLP